MLWNTEYFIQRAKEIHEERYDYSKVEYQKALIKVIIICKDHGEFEQTPSKHLNNRGCMKCSIMKNKENLKVSFEEFLRRAKEKHGDKFEYIKESYTDIRSKVKIICPNHGEFECDAVAHCIGSTGCKMCGFSQRAKKKTIPFEEFIIKSKEIHGDTYDYSKITENFAKRVTIVCKIHGEFRQLKYGHLLGRGCKKCSDTENGKQLRKSKEEFINDAKGVHGDLYDYSLIEYKTCKDKINIICKIHGIFEKIVSDHLNDQGCQQCRSKKHSKICISWLDYMKIKDNIYIQHGDNEGEHRIKNSLYHADGYCKETNTIYEFHGSYWHGDPRYYKENDVNPHMKKTFGELYNNTLKKIEHCKREQYIVIECWEADWKKGIKAVKILQKKYKSL